MNPLRPKNTRPDTGSLPPPLPARARASGGLPKSDASDFRPKSLDEMLLHGTDSQTLKYSLLGLCGVLATVLVIWAAVGLADGLSGTATQSRQLADRGDVPSSDAHGEQQSAAGGNFGSSPGEADSRHDDANAAEPGDATAPADELPNEPDAPQVQTQDEQFPPADGLFDNPRLDEPRQNPPRGAADAGGPGAAVFLPVEQWKQRAARGSAQYVLIPLSLRQAAIAEGLPLQPAFGLEHRAGPATQLFALERLDERRVGLIHDTGLNRQQLGVFHLGATASAFERRAALRFEPERLSAVSAASLFDLRILFWDSQGQEQRRVWVAHIPLDEFSPAQQQQITRAEESRIITVNLHAPRSVPRPALARLNALPPMTSTRTIAIEDGPVLTITPMGSIYPEPYRQYPGVQTFAALLENVRNARRRVEESAEEVAAWYRRYMAAPLRSAEEDRAWTELERARARTERLVAETARQLQEFEAVLQSFRRGLDDEDRARVQVNDRFGIPGQTVVFCFRQAMLSYEAVFKQFE